MNGPVIADDVVRQCEQRLPVHVKHGHEPSWLQYSLPHTVPPQCDGWHQPGQLRWLPMHLPVRDNSQSLADVTHARFVTLLSSQPKFMRQFFFKPLSVFFSHGLH